MRPALVFARLLLGLSLAGASLARAQTPILVEKAGVEGDLDPFGGRLTVDLNIYRLGDDGSVLFLQRDTPADRIYAATHAGVVRKLGAGARASDGSILSDFTLGGANDSGQLGVLAYKAGHQNVYLLTGSVLRAIATDTMAAPSGGLFTYFTPPALDNAGDLAFYAETDVFGGMGIFLVTPTPTSAAARKIAALADPAPQGGKFAVFDSRTGLGRAADGKITVFFNASLEDESLAFYAAQVDGANAPVLKKLAAGLQLNFITNHVGQAVYSTSGGLYLASFGGLSTIAQVGAAAPGGGNFISIAEAAINDAGTVVFRAAAGSASTYGLYLKTASGAVTLLARAGGAFGGATFTQFGLSALNQNSLIAYIAELGGKSALFLTDGTSTFKVISAGDALSGSTVVAPTFGQGLILGQDSLNLHGQIAFFATLATGKSGIFIATPTSTLRQGGRWDDPLTWNSRIVPGPDTPVLAQSASAASLQGPPAAATARKVRSLTVGGGSGPTTLELQPGSTLTAASGVSLLGQGVLAGSGGIGSNLTMGDGAKLRLELAGPARPAFDFLRVDGIATLSGTLEVVATGGFHPTRAQSFDLLDLRARNGTFKNVSLPALNPAALTWVSTSLYSTGAISVSGATLFNTSKGVFVGNLQGSPALPVNSGALSLTLGADGRLTGSILYAGIRYGVNVILSVDGSATLGFGSPQKVLRLQLSGGSQAPLFTATVSVNSVVESRSTSSRTAGVFDPKSPLVGHYTVAFPRDPAQTDPAFPQGTGYAILSVATNGLARLTGVLADGLPFSFGGPLTASGEFPFYIATYLNQGMISGQLTLHGATADAVEGSVHWVKPATTVAPIKTALEAKITIVGSGFQEAPAKPRYLEFPNGKATFSASAAGLAAIPNKAVTMAATNTFKADSGEVFALSLATPNFGLGTGVFLDSSKMGRAFRGVALQKQNCFSGFFTGLNQTGDIEVK